MKEFLANIFKLIFGLAFVFLLSSTAFLWFKLKAVKERVIVRTETITVTDTVTVKIFETQWRERVRSVIDTLFIIKPDTIYIVDKVLPPWQEKILRIIYEPPNLSFLAMAPNDTTMMRFVYNQVPWGFLIEPNPSGMLLVQYLEPPKPPAILIGYNWGIGLSWGTQITPAIFGEYYINYRKIRGTTLVNISAIGANMGIYFRWR